MGTKKPTKVMLGQTLVLMQMTFLNNVGKVGRLVLSRTSCLFSDFNVIYFLTETTCVRYGLRDFFITLYINYFSCYCMSVPYVSTFLLSFLVVICC
jgi:hypothetical protein